ncbi:MAG: TolC family protein [Abitibacteriaceae bacterium]|nr:TolC family protein [Abditibacteriaceae bacterium]MBV9867996.1 TolC family protein [Abditibacteriaceae bacterium]
MQNRTRYNLVVLLAGVFMGGQSVHAQPDPYQFAPPQIAAPVPVENTGRIMVQQFAGPVANVEGGARGFVVLQGGANQGQVNQVNEATVATAEKQWEQVGERYRQGLVTLDEVDQAQVVLTEVQIRFAQAQAQPADVMEKQITAYLEKLVATREHLVSLAEARYKAGVMTLADLNASRIQLSEARLRLELHRLVGLRAEDLTRVTALYQQGVVTQQEVDGATVALDAARNLAKSVEQTVVTPQANQPLVEITADKLLVTF